jgi:hypothetical protein
LVALLVARLDDGQCGRTRREIDVHEDVAISEANHGNAGSTAVTGNAAGRPSFTINEAVGIVGRYARLCEAKNLSGLQRLMSPNVVLKKGAKRELRGTDQVIAQYRRELTSFGEHDPPSTGTPTTLTRSKMNSK